LGGNKDDDEREGEWDFITTYRFLQLTRSVYQAHDSTAIDSIIRGLINRPNVHATLILSRKDGSIIKATGFINSRNDTNLARQTYGELLSGSKNDAGQDTTSTSLEQTTVTAQDTALTQVEILASSIYTFVAASVGLAKSMSLPDTSNELYNGQNEDNQAQSTGDLRDVSHGTAEEDIQLLRMRTRKQEIIIFPDPRYLCCVVQNIGKSAA
jgi:hypothetical protein